MHIYNFISCILDFVVLLCKMCLFSFSCVFMLLILQCYFSFSIVLLLSFFSYLMSIFNISTILLNNMARVNIFCFVTDFRENQACYMILWGIFYRADDNSVLSYSQLLFHEWMVIFFSAFSESFGITIWLFLFKFSFWIIRAWQMTFIKKKFNWFCVPKINPTWF